MIFVILAISSIRGCGATKQYQTEVKKWKDSVTTIANLHTAKEDSLSKISDQYNKSADSLKGVLSKLKQPIIHVTNHKIDSILVAAPDTCKPIAAILDSVRKERDSIQVFAVTWKLTSLRQDSLRVKSIDSLRVDNGLLKADKDSLVTELKKVPVYKSEKLLGFIPLPSRTASFVVGGILGGIGVFVLESLKK